MLSPTLMRCLTSSVVFACLIANVPAGAAPASPAPVPAMSPSPDACTHGDTISADDAFAREIDDARTLAFFSFVENIAPKDRAAVDKRASARPPKESTDAIDAALTNACDATEVDYRTTRLAYMMAKRWSEDEADDEADADEGAGRNAVAALFLGDRIPASVRDASLAVFGTSIDELDSLSAQAEAVPSPSPSSSPVVSACRLSARALRAINPVYPPMARMNGISGTIQIMVALDPHGYVRAATVYKSEFQPRGADGADLISEAIVAAGSSNYAPQFVDCKPIAGRYLFRVQYSRR